MSGLALPPLSLYIFGIPLSVWDPICIFQSGRHDCLPPLQAFEDPHPGFRFISSCRRRHFCERSMHIVFLSLIKSGETLHSGVLPVLAGGLCLTPLSFLAANPGNTRSTPPAAAFRCLSHCRSFLASDFVLFSYSALPIEKPRGLSPAPQRINPFWLFSTQLAHSKHALSDPNRCHFEPFFGNGPF